MLLAGLIIMLVVLFVVIMTLALCEAGADETGKSILYDDEDYFKHEEPEWLRKEEEE